MRVLEDGQSGDIWARSARTSLARLGFTTRDLTRCRHMTRLIALSYNRWSLFVRLAGPDHHRKEITSRPPLLHGVARQTYQAGQTRPTVTTHHGRRRTVVAALPRIAGFFRCRPFIVPPAAAAIALPTVVANRRLTSWVKRYSGRPWRHQSF